MGKRETFVDGDSVCHTVSRIKHDAGCTPGSVQRQYSLNGHVERRGVECFEHDLRHLFTVSLGVEGCLGEKDGVLVWSNAKFIVECMMPDLLHGIPISDDAMFDGVFEGQDTAL